MLAKWQTCGRTQKRQYRRGILPEHSLSNRCIHEGRSLHTCTVQCKGMAFSNVRVQNDVNRFNTLTASYTLYTAWSEVLLYTVYVYTPVSIQSVAWYIMMSLSTVNTLTTKHGSKSGNSQNFHENSHWKNSHDNLQRICITLQVSLIADNGYRMSQLQPALCRIPVK